eukprot:scaffold39307_cov69-Phaeocystis_antarctica.AAC.7
MCSVSQTESTHRHPGPPFERIVRRHAVGEARQKWQHHCPTARVEQHIRAHIGWETEGGQCPLTLLVSHRVAIHRCRHKLRLQAILRIAVRVLTVELMAASIVKVYRQNHPELRPIGIIFVVVATVVAQRQHEECYSRLVLDGDFDVHTKAAR